MAEVVIEYGPIKVATTLRELKDDEPKPAGASLFEIANKTGDTKLIWDKNNRDEVEQARKTFNDLVAKGFRAFKAEGEDGHQGSKVDSFDPKIERMILIPRMVGG